MILSNVSVALVVAICSQSPASLPDLALQPARIVAEIDADHARSSRGAQGVAAVERAPRGRLWAAWYAGKSPRGVESPSSYAVLATSDDDGAMWTEKLVLHAPRLCHTYDPCLWLDPTKRLWFFWAQSAGLQDGRMGVWAAVTDEPDAESPLWSEPRRISNGVMLNKPTVLSDGSWLLPVGHWRDNTNVPNITFDEKKIAPYTNAGLAHDLGEERGSNVVRTTDGGRTWSAGTMFLTGGTTASKRFFVRRLRSGALLQVRNNVPTGSARSHLTAFVSDDDGLTWQGGLLLDERESSYPDGRLYVIYDQQRYTLNRAGIRGTGSVLLAKFTEADVRAGRPMHPDTKLKAVVSRLIEN